MRLIFILSILMGCSNLSKNMVKEGTFTLRGGKHENQTWSESLTFRRYSWFHELTLFYDVMLADIPESSPFYQWFSPSEKRIISSCRQKKIAITYQMDSKKISDGMFEREIKKFGYSKYLVPQFEQSFNMHPDHENQSLQLYKIFVLCSKEDNRVAKVAFPSFREVDLE